MSVLFKHGPPVKVDLPEREEVESPVVDFPKNDDERTAQEYMRSNAKDFPHTEPFRRSIPGTSCICKKCHARGIFCMAVDGSRWKCVQCGEINEIQREKTDE